ncbi:MAG: phosphodiester glycosidase family protein [Limisphaerales bacterium]
MNIVETKGPSSRQLPVWPLLAAAALFFMMASQTPAQTVLGSWVPLFKGIDHAVGTNKPGNGGMPDLMVIYALRVDLTDPDIQLYATPRIANNYGVDARETAGYTVSNFLTMHGLQVAVNANYFHDPGTSDTESPSYTVPPGTPFDVIGLLISKGVVVSPQDSDDYTASFLFTTNNQVTFYPTNWPANPTTGIETAVTGLYTVLRNNLNVGSNYIGNGDFVHQVNPRTALGLSQDREYLYVLVIDGRQPGYSNGALDWETAKWLQKLGAWDGANMDGGGSSCMVIEGTTGKPIELNHDSAAAAYGIERTVGSQLGIYAKPLPGFINSVSALPDDTAASIIWETTSNATTQVQYGLATNFTYSSILLTNLVTNHAALLTNLTPGTGYYFAAYSQAGSTLYISSNYFFTTSNYATSATLLDLTNNWDYSTNDLDGVNWTAPGYDDSQWISSGPALFFTGSPAGVSFLNTQLPANPENAPFPFITYYFRTHFTYTNSLLDVTLEFTNYVDDGAVFYLNGVEIDRLRMPEAPTPILNSTLATNYPCNGYATCPDLFSISGPLATNLVSGDNVLAVEVHLDDPQAQTITFGSTLVAALPLAVPPQLGILSSNRFVTLDWSRGGFILQQAGALAGPWTSVPGPVVSSPFISTNLESNAFFRLWRP